MSESKTRVPDEVVWDSYRDVLEQKWLREDLTLVEVMAFMEKEYGFDAKYAALPDQHLPVTLTQ